MMIRRSREHTKVQWVSPLCIPVSKIRSPSAMEGPSTPLLISYILFIETINMAPILSLGVMLTDRH